jgi:hypothetical protein
VGYHACGATTSPCYSDTDVTRCGNGCTDCRQPNANAACGTGDLCANTCTASAFTLSCPSVGGKPNCSQWDFESGSSEDWQFGPVPAASNAATGALFTWNEQAASGGASLAIPYNNAGDVNRFVEIRIPLCAGGNVLDLSGKRLHWSFRMVPADPGGYNYLQVYDAPNFGGGWGTFDFNADADEVWDEYDVALDTLFDQVFGIGFHLQATTDYDGVLYLDDVRIY